MGSSTDIGRSFRQRFAAGDHLIGTFLKTPTGHATEILGDLGFDFVIVDEEHAPFDRNSIDHALLAAKAAGIASLVRVAEPTATNILSVLDNGAAGVLVPHVSSAAKAREVAAACSYRGGKRGFSNTTRAGDYGSVGLWNHVDASDASVTLVAMIEDPEALDEVDAIAQTDGLHGAFIGRGDLTVAMGAAGMEAPEVRAAVERITAAMKRAGKPVCVMANSVEDAKAMRALGATAFVIASDQGFMRQGAMKALADYRPIGA